ncbi:ATP-binding cassette subfamily C protein LapB [Serratia fonticola]|jgi:ATP-binding cassette subfamily C protein LapB|uniref:ATP-binding cassette subfamily C protein LapB n=1 Tax=Serratia fonticola TaxID=47917 RepID=A0A542BUK6_SERFO|nr:type I secretion system permease/ATPase [Serratia fonticola]TQI82254.1 ATP-binding cassette subfamily C protein LapB [Serratia fonticola]TQI95726.1 ATP-binding cassette subfamily C protein LapB [Serratia fonticola]TVZ70221.1 ATP-binding cassette subfamily C protein LapB [Serratia fonticola]
MSEQLSVAPVIPSPAFDNIEDHGADTLLWAVEWLCQHHNKLASKEVLYAGLPRSKKLDPELALRMLDQVGVAAGWIKRDLAKISTYLFPLVIARNDGTYCIIASRKGKKGHYLYQMVVPESGGTLSLSEAEVIENYNGYAMVANPKPQLDKRSDDEILPQANREGHWLFSTLWRYRHYFYSAALAALLANILTLATTFFTMNVYDRVIPTQAYVTLWSLAIGVLIAIVFEFTSRQVRTYLIDVAGKKADLVLGAKLFRQVMAMRMESKPQSTGSFANQLRDFEAVRDFVTSATLSTLSDLPFCILFMFIIYLIGGQLAVVPLVAVPIILAVSVLIQWPLSRYMGENIREISLKQGLLIEAVEGLEALKAARGEGVMQKRWDDFSALAAASSMKTRYLSSLTSNFVTFMQQVTTVVIVLYGVYLIHAGDLTMGSMIGVVILSGRSLGPLAAVVGLALRYQHAKTALKSLNQLMELPTERDPAINYLPTPKFTGNLRLKKVGFAYPVPGVMVPPPILDNINITIQAGERVAIIGSIGSGKSTLLRVMGRIFQPRTGQISIDGVDATQVDPADWRAAVGYVSQDCRLFFGTLRYNVTIGNPGASTEEFLRVARMTGLDRIAAKHPLGYDMPVGEMGNGLSGGQKQLVALARCLLLRPKILLMDEPTSSMDAMTETLFIRQLQKAIEGQTLVIVTHRTSVLNIFDRLIVLDDGHVIADGPKEQVIAMLNANTQKNSQKNAQIQSQ